MIAEDDDGVLLWFKRNEDRTRSLSYFEFLSGDRELYRLSNLVGRAFLNPTQEQIDEMIAWLEGDKK